MWIHDDKDVCLCIILVVVLVCLALGLDIAITYGFIYLIDKVANTSLLDKFWYIYVLLLIAKMWFGKSVSANG